MPKLQRRRLPTGLAQSLSSVADPPPIPIVGGAGRTEVRAVVISELPVSNPCISSGPMFAARALLRRRLLTFGHLTALLIVLELLFIVDIWWDGMFRSEEPDLDVEEPRSFASDECAIKQSDGMKQKAGRFCDAQCVPWNQTLALNQGSTPSVPSHVFEGICQGLDARNCVQPFKTIETDFQYYWTMKPQKTIMCTIPKTSSQLMTAIMCLLNDELGFFYEGKEMFGNYYGPTCSKHRVKSVEHAARLHGPEALQWTKLTVVREPVDRFLSGFVFACVRGVDFATNCTRFCHGCGANLTCFVERELAEMLRLSRGEQRAVGFLAHHQYPQTWRCGLGRARYTVLRYSPRPRVFVGRVLRFLRARNVSRPALAYIGRVALAERTHHATAATEARRFFEKRLRSSPYLMEKVVRMFYHDFKTFGYPLPMGIE